MKAILYLVILSLPTIASAETVQKWTDETGKVHYGNSRDAVYGNSTETLIIRDTFDQKEYKAGLARQKDDERVGAQYEKERTAETRKKQLAEEKRHVNPSLLAVPHVLSQQPQSHSSRHKPV